MILHTNRLSIRNLILSDLEDIHDLLSLPETDEYNTLGIPENIEATKIILEDWLVAQNTVPRTSYVFCIIHHESKQFIGCSRVCQDALQEHHPQVVVVSRSF